jgi:hypothetical protein
VKKLNPTLTTAQPGWFYVEWWPSEVEPTAARFWPIVAWGTIETDQYTDGPDTVPVAVIVEEDSCLRWVSGDERHCLGMCQPGHQSDPEWTEMAKEAWREWREKLKGTRT